MTQILILTRHQKTPLTRQALIFAEAMQNRGFEPVITCPGDHDIIDIKWQTTSMRMPENEVKLARRLGLVQRKTQIGLLCLFIEDMNSDDQFRLKQRFDLVMMLARDPRQTYRVDLLWNPMCHAASHVWHCSPDAKLLLGPRYALVSNTKPPVSGTHTLRLWSSQSWPSLKRLKSLARQLEGNPRLELVVDDQNENKPENGFTTVTADSALPAPVLTLTDAGLHCLELSAAGCFYITFAGSPTQLEHAYALEQMGYAPTIGTMDGRSDNEIRSLIGSYFDQRKKRIPFVNQGKQSVDGRGPDRLAFLLGPKTPIS